MKIAMIGCGNMGRGLAERLSQANQLFLYDRHKEKLEKLAKEGHGKACSEIEEALGQAEMVILAVKPQNIEDAADLIKKGLIKDQILVSILTGISISTLREYFSNKRIVRMMPNLPVIYGEGVIGLTAEEAMKNQIGDELSKLFEVLGKVYWLPEEKIDGLTALTGSGPAFFFAMIEGMIEAGIAMGFSAKDAKNLVHQMLQGSLSLLDKTAKHPSELKWQITSPGGTTIAGLKVLEEKAIKGGIMNTFLAAYERSKELSL
jgi:pyrroline-5-carboxylate reductase